MPVKPGYFFYFNDGYKKFGEYLLIKKIGLYGLLAIIFIIKQITRTLSGYPNKKL